MGSNLVAFTLFSLLPPTLTLTLVPLHSSLQLLSSDPFFIVFFLNLNFRTPMLFGPFVVAKPAPRLAKTLICAVDEVATDFTRGVGWVTSRALKHE